MTAMHLNLTQLIQKRELLAAWTGRIIRTRYQQSVLGGLWVVIQPAAIVAIFTVIFTFFVPIDTGDMPYVVFSYTAMVPWLFLAQSLPDMANSLVGNMDIIKKIYFPREILPLAAMLARLIDLFVAAILLILLILFFRVPLFPTGWLFLPVILIIQAVLITGLGLALAAANAFYRDVQPLAQLGIQLWFYASPIIYPVSMVPDSLRPFYFLNPMAGILEAYREVLLNQSMPGSYLYITGAVSLIVFIAGYWFFKRVEFQIVDIV
jgi:lipopolysaccharide transport system permease protein